MGVESPRLYARKRLDSIFNKENHIEQTWSGTTPKTSRFTLVQAVLIAIGALILGIFASPRLGFAVIKENDTIRDLNLKLYASKLLCNKYLESARRKTQSDGLLPVRCVEDSVPNDTPTKAMENIAITPQFAPKAKSTKSNFSDSTPPKLLKMLPSSDVSCTGTHRHNRICRFRNLCYSTKREEWMFLKTSQSTIFGFPPKGQRKISLLELSSIENHSYFYWNYVEASPFIPELQNLRVRYENSTHFLFKRLHPNNIMHNLHDDMINMFHLFKEILAGTPSSVGLPFSLDNHYLMTLDEYERKASTNIYKYLSDNPIRFSTYLNQTDADLVCFRDAVLGSKKITRWYQYGFAGEPQGPVHQLPNGMHVREFGQWILGRLSLPLGFDEVYPPKAPPLLSGNVDFPETNLILVLIRKSNRLILNQDALKESLSRSFKMEAKFVSNEEYSFEEQVALMRKARIVIGMHGSIMVMALFCRRGTVLIEMYPFAVPSEHYTPYRTMANLPNMDLVYRAWENKYEDKTIGHPKRHQLHGGLEHLSKEEREKVLNTKTVPQHICCKSPYWLYRIYQDTEVNITEIKELIKGALNESRKNVLPKIYKTNTFETDIRLPGIKNIKCIQSSDKPEGVIWAKWEQLWTGAKVDSWEVLVNNDGKIYPTLGNQTSIQLDGYDGDVVFFVRAVRGTDFGPWGVSAKCSTKSVNPS